MSDVYVAIRDGVYRHQVVYAGTDRDDVIAGAKEAILREYDSYHRVVVVRAPTGKPGLDEPVGYWTWPSEWGRNWERAPRPDGIEPEWRDGDSAPNWESDPYSPL